MKVYKFCIQLVIQLYYLETKFKKGNKMVGNSLICNNDYGETVYSSKT